MTKRQLRRLIREEIKTLKRTHLKESADLDDYYNKSVKFEQDGIPYVGEVVKFEYGKLEINIGGGQYILKKPNEVKVLKNKPPLTLDLAKKLKNKIKEGNTYKHKVHGEVTISKIKTGSTNRVDFDTSDGNWESERLEVFLHNVGLLKQKV